MTTAHKIYNWEDTESCQMLSIEDLPYNEAGFKVSIYGSKELQISRYFRRLLTSYQDNSQCDSILIPSVKVLANFFSCETEQVLHGLEDLVKRGYGYEIEGLNTPVKIWDPLSLETKESMSLNDLFKSFLFHMPKPGDVRLDPYTHRK